MYKTEKFEKQLEELQITISPNQIEQLIRYYEMLVERNKVMNLTAITDYDEVMTKHFIDSLSIAKAIDLSCESFQKTKMIDMGTGAGFPGLPIKIVWPQIEMTLADSLNKRLLFLDDVINELHLTGVSTMHGRAEDIGHNKISREKYDICVSRAVANISTLSEYCLPLVKKGGYFIPYKTKTVDTEIEESGNAINMLGGVIRKKVEYVLPGTDIDRTLLLIEKQKNTPNKYPRKAGTPGKEPLK